jgi:hypothetical protein
MPLRMPNVGQQVDGAIGLAILGTVAWTVVANTARHAAAVARGAAAAAVKAGHQCPDMVDMEVIVRLRDRGAKRLDHLHDQALCGPKGAGNRRSST